MESLQTVLFVGIIVLAVIAIASLAWAMRLANKLHHRAQPKHYDVNMPVEKLFTNDDMAVISTEASGKLTQIVEASAGQFQAGMATIVKGLSSKTDETVGIAIGQELEKFSTSLDALRQQTIIEFTNLEKELDEKRTNVMGEIEAYKAKAIAEADEKRNTLNAEIEERRANVKAEVDAVVTKESEARLEGFNARLNDVVSSYIAESLDKSVDLGAQTAYIIATLESHKEDIKKDILA